MTIPEVDIICSVRNGAPFIAEFLRSAQAQTHEAWRMWLRDDGSTDSTADIVAEHARADARIRLLNTGGSSLGVAGAFGWVLERVPPDADYVFTADADDVWLPHKIARTLDVMRAEEHRRAGPLLVHSDLTVVDSRLAVIDASFWHFAGLDPEPVSLRRLMVQNVATSPTVLINRPLRELVGAIPAGAVVHDWWLTLVACAFGRIVAMRESTVLYRQHGANDVGARRPTASLPWTALPGASMRAMRHGNVRAAIAATARQAQAFLDRYGPALDASDRRFVEAYARIPERGFLRRKFDVARLRLLREHGVLRNVGILLRA